MASIFQENVLATKCSWATWCFLHGVDTDNRWYTQFISCEICNKRYKTRSSLRQHINMHNAEHICRICSSLFKAEYLKHKSRSHSVPYLCSTCGKSFTRHSSLTEHNKQHSDKKETCPFEKCGKTCIRKQLLADHINSHTGVKPYSCDKCKKTFVSQSSYSVTSQVKLYEKN